MLTRWIVGGLVVCAAIFAWAVHDVSRTWNDSLRLPDVDA